MSLTCRGLLAALALTATSCLADVPEGAEVPMHTDARDWRDDVVYQLLTDRFANGDPRNDYRVDPTAMARYHGGDWQGVIDHLDYLSHLGVTAVWISPIVLNVDTDAGIDAYHGYWAVDLTRLNPHFGDLGALRRMVDACHARGIKVIVDIVTNHLGQVFYYDINQNGRPDESVFGSGTSSMLSRVTEYDPDYDPRGIQSFTSLGEAGAAPIRFFDVPGIFREPPVSGYAPSGVDVLQTPEAYHRRGRIVDYGVTEQVLFGDFPGGLKDVATENPDVQEAMTQAYVNWVLRTDIDAFRIDTLKHVGDDFWEYFAPQLRMRLAAKGKTNFFLFGEAFTGDDALLGHYTQPNRMDSVFYFSQKFSVYRDVFSQGMATKAIEDLWSARRTNWSAVPQPGGVGVAPVDLPVNFMDNHDVSRFLYDFSSSDATLADGERHLEAALTLMFTEPGVPCVYYGTEQGFHGGNDPSNREDLWATGYDESGPLFARIRTLAALRAGYDALRRGDVSVRWSTTRMGGEQDAGIFAFERATADGQRTLVVIETEAKSAETSATSMGGGAMLVGAAPGTVLHDVLGGHADVTVDPTSHVTVRLGPFESAVYVPSDQVH